MHPISRETIYILYFVMGDGFANFVWFGCGIPNLLNTISSSMYCLIFHSIDIFYLGRITSGYH